MWVLLKAVPLKAADTTRKFRVPKVRGANPRFASVLRRFLSEIERESSDGSTSLGLRKVDLVERNASVPLKAVPVKAAETTRKFRVLSFRGANLRFASAVRCFLSGIESPGAAVPGTKGHRKVDLVERNASVPLKATETTLRNFCPSLHRKLH